MTASQSSLGRRALCTCSPGKDSPHLPWSAQWLRLHTSTQKPATPCQACSQAPGNLLEAVSAGRLAGPLPWPPSAFNCQGAFPQPRPSHLLGRYKEDFVSREETQTAAASSRGRHRVMGPRP